MIELLKKVARKITVPPHEVVGIPYWEERAKQYGARSVLNISHTAEELAEVTQMQIRQIFPYLRQELNGSERVILDYGCGPGRFTKKLANLIHGEAIGVDPIETLIDMAPRAANVRYELACEGRIPLMESCVDVVWICLVMGGIVPKAIEPTCLEIERVLKPGGLLFVVENTTERKPASENWSFRSVAQYCEMFASFATLKHLHDYFDVGERVSLLAGRKETRRP
jgi:ubiquinone/menaquinone biosynthesis C-methylase UbiE